MCDHQPGSEGKSPMDFKTVKVAGVRIFYREAGDPSKPTIILLHGFPQAQTLPHAWLSSAPARRRRTLASPKAAVTTAGPLCET
jgi:hypothetical protein